MSRVAQETEPEAVADEAESEAEMILGRLVATQELRVEGRRLEREGRERLASDITIPAGWVDVLSEGLAMTIEVAERDCADGELSDTEVQHVERARRLASALRDLEPGSAYSVSPGFHEELLAGLGVAFSLQNLKANRLSEHDPPGLRFIEQEQLRALYELFRTLEDIVEED